MVRSLCPTEEGSRQTKSVGSQEALLLLRASFSAPKVAHLLRCSPSFSHPALLEFDGLLRTALEHITNCSFADTEWLQVSLPIKDGGLGIRRVSSLALPAFLSSAAKTSSLQDRILAHSPRSDCQYFQDYLLMWLSSFGEPSHLLPFKQSFWNRPGVELDRASLEASLVIPYQ